MPSSDARNTAPREGAMPFWSYLAAVSLAGLALLGWQISTLQFHDIAAMGAGFVLVAALIVGGELLPLIAPWGNDPNGVNLSTAFVFALLLHWGLGAAVLMQAVATLLAQVIRRRAWWRVIFNIGQYTLSYAAAGSLLTVFGHGAAPASPHGVDAGDLPVVLAAGCLFFLVNDLLVGVAVSLRSHEPLPSCLLVDAGYNVASTGALLGLAPLIVLALMHDVALVPLLALPIAAVYGIAAMSRVRERLLLRDVLTGLANRKLLIEKAGAALARAHDERGRVALFVIDLDRFKEINDTLGHQVGDRLLQLVAARLVDVVRPDDLVSRLGGDEFALLLTDLSEPRAAFDVADRVRAALAEPFRDDDVSFEIDGSIGIALYPEHGADFETLLRRADVAMYVAKENNTGVQVYSTEIDRHSPVRLGMLGELRTALDERQLELHYQPKADLRTGDVVGVEALLRWEHPQRGMVPPDEFLPLAEQTGLMRRITEFVAETALAQVAQWWAEGLRVQVAINASARDLYDRGFAERLAALLRRFEVPPRALLVEVTESVLMADPARAASTLTSLAERGIGVSLDDFGTGYSSLVHLKRLPVSEVKIDRSFVMRMDVNDDDAAIVRSIIDLAGALGLRVVAEGVETRQAWERLAVYGCDAAQGFHLARALPPQAATEWLRRHSVPRPRPAAVAESGQLLA